MDNWKIIFSAVNTIEIYSARNYLESEGIETMLQNELSAQIYSNVTDTIKLLVKEEDIEEATRILMQGGYIK